MAKKIQVKLIDAAGKETIFSTKTLTKLFNQKENYGKAYKLQIQEPDKSEQWLDACPLYTVQGVTTPPPVDTPPKVEAGEDITVGENQKVILDGSATDLGGQIIRTQWKGPDGIQLDPTVGPMQASFTTPSLNEGEEARGLIFTFEAEDDTHHISSDTTIVDVRKVVTPPPTHECPQGQHWDEAQQKCVDNDIEPPTGDNMDKFGIPFFHKSKPNGYFLEQGMTPQSQPGFDHIDTEFTVNGDVITMKPNGPTSFGVGRNINGFKDAIDGCAMSFKKTAERGYSYKPDDVRDLEFKCLMNVKGIGAHGISISACTGHHDSAHKPCCQGFAYMFNVEVSTNPADFRFRKEMWHVDYSTSPEGNFNHPQANFKIDGHGYVGIGVCRYNKQNPGAEDSVILEGWFNPDPIKDIKNWILIKRIEDKKGNGWGSTGDQCDGDKDQVGTWSGPQNRLKTNATSGSIDFKAISFREIVPELV
jgi:hypothetical protein